MAGLQPLERPGMAGWEKLTVPGLAPQLRDYQKKVTVTPVVTCTHVRCACVRPLFVSRTAGVS